MCIRCYNGHRKCVSILLRHGTAKQQSPRFANKFMTRSIRQEPRQWTAGFLLFLFPLYFSKNNVTNAYALLLLWNKVSNANALLQIKDYTKEQGSKAFKKLCFLYRPKEKIKGTRGRKFYKRRRVRKIKKKSLYNISSIQQPKSGHFF